MGDTKLLGIMDLEYKKEREGVVQGMTGLIY